MMPVSVAIARDPHRWHERFIEALAKRRAAGENCSFQEVDINGHDWLAQIEPHDVLLWKPAAMGAACSSHVKEKIYFIERHLNKIVAPNFSSTWHFESKVAQSYLLHELGVPTPRTTISFDYHDAMALAETAMLPAVVKGSAGAAGKKVRLVHSRRALKAYVNATFCEQLWAEARSGGRRGPVAVVARHIASAWLWRRMFRRALGWQDQPAVSYWQEFIAGNDADLRITTIGDRSAFGFWRRNRPGDFRASGSGDIDYARAVPSAAVQLCLDLSRRCGFSTMCYDLLIKDGAGGRQEFMPHEILVVEMSTGYLDTAVHAAPGHFRLDARGQLQFVPGHIWPQELWVEWALERARLRFADGSALSNGSSDVMSTLDAHG